MVGHEEMAQTEEPAFRQVLAEALSRRPESAQKLWLRGDMPVQGPRVATVGSLAAQPMQLQQARDLATWLVQAGAVVVSGGAEGIDYAALEGTLRAGGKPIAVLAAGLNCLHPQVNVPLFEAMVAGGGLLVSQFAPDTQARQAQFLQRNILITQVVDAVIAVCAGGQSGTLHCATRAEQAGLLLFATPWTPGTANSEGSNALLAGPARAIWNEAGCRALIAGLAAGDVKMPSWQSEARSRAPKRSRQSALPGVGVIDAVGGAKQCYRPDVVTAGAVQPTPTGCDPALLAALKAALGEAGPPGLTSEELACALAIDRGLAASLCLDLVLQGWLARAPGGLLTLR